MGLASWLGLKAATDVTTFPRVIEVPAPNGGTTTVDLMAIMGQSPAELWRTQPHLRTVVDFLARNVAQLGLHIFERVSDVDRKRVTDGAMAGIISRPNLQMTWFELVRALVADLALYDRAYWVPQMDNAGRWGVAWLPASWVTGARGGSLFAPGQVQISPPAGQSYWMNFDDLLYFHGWDPTSPAGATPPVHTLKLILSEQMNAYAFRVQRWKSGARVGSVLTRPADAPAWSPEAEKQFREDFKTQFTGNRGPQAGGTPILQDGMTLTQVGFTAVEDQFVDATKLSLTTVASVFHVNPTMIGVLDNANYSNVREFRRMLYGDTLGPILAMIEDRIDTFLLPRLGDKPNLYVHFNVAAKIQGSFEEQAAVLSSSVGAPWMTRNEARARENLPAITGGDALVTPLNVLLGGQASPRDSAPKARAVQAKSVQAVARIKSDPTDDHQAVAAAVLRKFFRRQRTSVLSALGSKDGTPWWDDDRWNSELASDLYALAMKVAQEVSADILAALGLEPDAYDPAKTEAFLQAVAASRAAAINQATRSQLMDAVEQDEAPADVFEQAEGSRALAAGITLATTYAAFATKETAYQVAPDRATKTWSVRSSKPRKAHKSMDGETVGIEEKFSNGADWPGDPVLGADGVAGCTCVIQVDIS
jgi:HK97 family phage portal protein